MLNEEINSRIAEIDVQISRWGKHYQTEHGVAALQQIKKLLAEDGTQRVLQVIVALLETAGAAYGESTGVSYSRPCRLESDMCHVPMKKPS